MLDTSNEAKVSLILDINNALKSIKTLQSKLDEVSLNNIKVKDVESGTKKISNGIKKAKDEVRTFAQALSQAKKELAEMTYANRMNIDFSNSDAYKAKKKEIQDLIFQQNQLNQLIKTLDSDKEQRRINKENEQAIKHAEQLASEMSRNRIEAEKEISRIKKEQQNYYDSEMKATNALLKYQQQVKDDYVTQKSNNSLKQEVLATQELLSYQDQVKKNYRHFNELANNVRQKQVVTNPMEKELEATQALLKYQQEQVSNYRKLNELAKTLQSNNEKQEKTKQKALEQEEQAIKNKKAKIEEFKSYSSELAKLEKRASQIYRQLNDPKFSSKHAELRTELEKITQEYAKLNREAVNFRKHLGVSHSRGFYDLNHSFDYLFAKVRSGFYEGLSNVIANPLANMGDNILHTLSNYERNKINFMQIMPEEMARNQDAVNISMKEFTQIASDYGANVNEVTEAGRLWGRQYKDLAIIQELVRASTKLSITDNMSLTEVNKGLEATMQQYNIHLKDSNEAMRVSSKIVDSWAKLADNAVVTASDLAKANERSASAAYQSGVGFDYLQAMITTMSSATGKAGGEIGRSIRSMLVSMRSANAEKEFAKLGIATKELVDGEWRVRSFEKVITELMYKLKTSSQDVYKVINAMAGGKYQFNNIMALLTNQNEFLKNLQIVQDSQGWADEQVARQYETVHRQIQALNADMNQFIVTLDKAGSNKFIADIIKWIRSIIQGLNEIDSEVYSRIGNLTLHFVGLKFALWVLPNLLGNIKVAFNDLKTGLLGFNKIFDSTKQGITNVATLVGTVTRVANILFALFTLTQLGMGIYDAWAEKQEKINKLNETSSRGLIESTKNTNEKVTKIRELNNAIQENTAILKDSNATDKQKAEAERNLIKAKEDLLELLPKEAKERVLASGYSREAIEEEVKVLLYLAKQQYTTAVKSTEAQIASTKNTIDEVANRIKAYEEEIKVIEERSKLLNKIAENTDDVDINNDSDYSKNVLAERKKELEESKKLISELEQKLKASEQRLDDLKAGYKQANIKGVDGGTVDGDETGKSGRDYAEETRRNQLSRERNQLWLDGRIEAQAYENALKAITNLEQAYGSTEYSINQKTSLFKSRIEDLNSYQLKLETFRDSLVSILDEEMNKNQRVAEMVGYKSDMTLQEKLRSFEVNKQLYQQEKTYSTIANLISTVNAKIEKTKGDTLEVAKNLEQQEEVLHNQKISDINQKYQLEDTMINRPTNYSYETQKIKLQIAQQLELIAQRNARIKELEQDLAMNQAFWSDIKIESVKNEIKSETLLREQHNQKLAELEFQKNYNIRNGLAEITQSFLIQGNSLRDIWKNLWQDLAREAIQRLFQVKATASLLGNLFGLFGGGGKTPEVPATLNYADGVSWGDVTKNWQTVDWIPKMNHTGANVGTYPKMHTGGVVADGRIGVVPKLQNNEVIRTLQVGEEVNSLQDRRSNEMLTAIVLKALDSQNQKPTNINIFAMDSKSFAEYLNQNADILTAVLAKQGAMGRR